MFSAKNTLFNLFLIFSLGSTGCGLKPGPTAPPPFATAASQAQQLSLPQFDSTNPQIVVDSSNRIYIVWQSNNSVVYTSSPDGGVSFIAPVLLTGTAGGTFPRITTDGNGNAYVIWYYPNPPTNYILFNYTTGSSGAFQTNPLTISTMPVPSPQGSAAPPADLTYDSTSKSLFIAWNQCSGGISCPTNDIYYSTVNLTPPITGANFSPVVLVSNGFGFASYPKIMPVGGIPYILYSSSSPTSNLFLAKMTTPTPITFNVGNPSVALNASLGVNSNGDSFVAWNPNQPQPGIDVFFNTLTATGTRFNFFPPLNLTNNGSSYGSVIALDSSQYVYVAFFSRTTANPNAYDLFLTRTPDGGVSFTGAMNISNSIGDSASYSPGMAIVGKTAYMVWDDNTLTQAGNHQIFFQKLTLN
ncbi:MAG: hypothetical protein ACYDBV_15170 [Nitrospiria bacterium]